MLGRFFSFKTFVFPSIVKFVYWIGLIFIGLLAITLIVSSLSAGNSPQFGGSRTAYAVGGVLASIVVSIVGVIIWRVIIELWLVLFSIHDVLTDIRDNRASR